MIESVPRENVFSPGQLSPGKTRSGKAVLLSVKQTKGQNHLMCSTKHLSTVFVSVFVISHISIL